VSSGSTPTRPQALCAYALSAAATLLWVACALPSGPLEDVGAGRDAATPFRRAAPLIVPALLLLVTVPVGTTLSRRERGLRAVLAGTDAFLAGYGALTLRAWPFARDAALGIGLVLLSGLAVLSLVEAWRCVRPVPPPPVSPHLRGIRLAICLLALMTPAHLLLPSARDASAGARALLLLPFVLVALGAAGAALARSMAGLRRACAVVQAAVATVLLLALRHTIREAPPALSAVGPSGVAALGLGLAVVALAVLQLALPPGPGTPAPEGETDPAEGEREGEGMGAVPR
jgi:hypothetical protein